LQTLAESFSRAGVPVFMADVKGDLAGISRPGDPNGKLNEPFQKRAAQIGIELEYEGYPVTFWDVWGERGHPVRTTPSEMGPLLLSRLMGLSDVQEGVLNIAFRVADEQGLALLDMKDLQSMLIWIGENAKDLSLRYGNVSTASVGAIQRSLMVLENEGGDRLFGEPALELSDIMRLDASGRGMVNILSAEKLMNSPRLYATFLLWLMSELFEQLPEVGDPDKPRIAFFFDEAHLLFDDAPPALIAKIEQVARLIRSKGVSLWFISQNPADLPEAVLGQLGNRVQHALRAFTAKDQKALRMAAQNYRANPAFDTGEAVTSLLEAKGVPGIVQRTLVRPPSAQLGPISDDERASMNAASPMALKYGKTLDRESAAEILARRTEAAAQESAAAEAKGGAKGGDADLWSMDREHNRARRYDPRIQIPDDPQPRSRTSRSSSTDSIVEAFGKSFARQLGTKSGQALVRGVLGSLFRGK
ncbi:MAG TPA: DUF853 family protein, partial [Paracoccus sp. (in: a-proteobacteria)]|nr:DUF853 family protein [Paracoccus sp. (in: a-proteobacteria)]